MNNETGSLLLAEQREALDLYLDSLYDETERTEEPAVGSVVSLVVAGGRVPPGAAGEEEAPVEGELQPRSLPPNDVGALDDEGKGRLKLLLFNLAGLKMAVPMAEVDGVLDWPEQVENRGGDASLLLGVLPDRGEKIPVIDLARLIIPQRLRVRQKQLPFERILLIGGRRWGLACNGVAEVVTVDDSAVNWRTERLTRKWLAGTIAGHGSALLDTVALVRLLERRKEASVERS